MKDLQAIRARQCSEGVHYVFLEGPRGAGKRKVLERLQSMGFSTIPPALSLSPSLSFSPYCANGTRLFRSPSPPSLSPILLSTLWAAEFLSQFLSHLPSASNPKENVVFVHRSPLTCSVYNQNNGEERGAAHWHSVLAALRQHVKASVVYCKADEAIILERLGGRHWTDNDGNTDHVSTPVFSLSHTF